MKKNKKISLNLILLCGFLLCFFLPFEGNVILAQSITEYTLDVTKTASTSFTRAYTWGIVKTANYNELTLIPGSTFDVIYEIAADTTGHIDSDWKVEGTITIENRTPIEAIITDISDIITPGDISASISCTSFPITLAPGESLDCTYSANLPSGEDGTNTVTVIASGEVGGGTATAEVDFGRPPTTVLDACSDVTDALAPDPNLGTACIDNELPKLFKYLNSIEITVSDCYGIQIVNTASFTTKDIGRTGSDGHTLTINVPCDFGCTHTQGYWKTHNASFWGGASKKVDDTWELIGPLDEMEGFFLSEQSYYEVLWTPPKGNVYYILARAYIAAELNLLNGADASAAQEAFDAATALFATYTPDQISALKGKGANTARAKFINLAEILDNYNNGLIGPGPCSEEPTPESESNLAFKSGTLEETDVVQGTDITVQNYPNPFYTSTTFSFVLPEESEVELTIFTLSGNKMAVITKGLYPAGKHQINWQAPVGLSPGMYLYQMQAGSSCIIDKMVFR